MLQLVKEVYRKKHWFIIFLKFFKMKIWNKCLRIKIQNRLLNVKVEFLKWSVSVLNGYKGNLQNWATEKMLFGTK
mgnify:CR=1 FL=1